jgi:hypothetical protein
MRSETADSEKRSKPNCRDKTTRVSAMRESIRILLVTQKRRVSRAILR